ncbi:hypothetical protein ACP70R_037849 [Stipagrostis hirtigluma subsp. patula]
MEASQSQGGAEAAPAMKLLFVEMGVGYDQHGQDITAAAVRACKDAISSNSIPAFRRGSIPGVNTEQMKLQIKLGVPRATQHLLDAESVKAVFPYGSGSGEAALNLIHFASVNLKYEDDTPVDSKGYGRKVIDKLQQTYAAELANKDFAYDGEKSLFTIGALPQVKNESTVVLEDVSTGKTAANGSPQLPPHAEPIKAGEIKKLSKPTVNLKYEDDTPVDSIGYGHFAYDGEKSLFTIGALPQVKNEFTIVLEDFSIGKTAANGSPPLRLHAEPIKAEEIKLSKPTVNLKYEDDTPVDNKGYGRKVIDKLQQTYAAELANKDFPYDGEKSLFTIGALPQVKNESTVVLEDVSTGKTAANGSPPLRLHAEPIKAEEIKLSKPTVNLKYEDYTPVDSKGCGRKVIDKLQQIYAAELANKDFAYDGEKSFFTIGALPQVKNEFTVVLEDVSTGKTAANGSPGNDSPSGSDRKRVRRPYQTKLSYAVKIPMSAIAQALRGQESEHTQEAIRVIDIILRQHSAKQGCLLVCQSFFHDNPSNFVDLGGGVMGCRGFHFSFRATQRQSGLSLNIDVSTTMIVKPGPVIDFLLANQKAKRALKNLRIKVSPGNNEYNIVGLSDRICKDQMFTLKNRNGGNGDSEAMETSVYDYFVNKRGIDLRYSGAYPCINVGKPKRPTLIPMELCSLVPLQRYTKALSTLQRSSLVEKSRQKPQERMSVPSDVLQRSNYDALMAGYCRPLSTIRRKLSSKYEWSILDAPETEGWNAEYCTEEHGPTNCITGAKNTAADTKLNDLSNSLPSSRRNAKDKQHYLNFHMRVMHADRSLFLVTDNGLTFEYLKSNGIWLWLRHEHTAAMKGALGSYNGSLYLVDVHGNLHISERNGDELLWINCTAMRKGRQVVSGSPWDGIPGLSRRVTTDDALFFVNKRGRLLQFTVGNITQDG